MKKTVINRMKTVFDSDSKNESFARCTVTTFISRLDPDTEELADIRTAVSEAVTNAIIHGYKKSTGYVSVDVILYSDRSVKITVKDKGVGIEDIEQAKLPLYTTDDSGERGGMGFVIMESFSDRLKVVSSIGKGTTVTMYKKLK